MLGTSQAWSVSPLSHRPSDPAYHIEDCRISWQLPRFALLTPTRALSVYTPSSSPRVDGSLYCTLCKRKANYKSGCFSTVKRRIVVQMHSVRFLLVCAQQDITLITTQFMKMYFFKLWHANPKIMDPRWYSWVKSADETHSTILGVK